MKNNNNLIPINKQKLVEEIRELEDKNLSISKQFISPIFSYDNPKKLKYLRRF